MFRFRVSLLGSKSGWEGFRFLGLSGLGVSGFSVWGLRFSDFRVFLVLFFCFSFGF